MSKKNGSKKRSECDQYILDETRRIVKRETGKELPKGQRGESNACPLARVFNVDVGGSSDIPLKKRPKNKLNLELNIPTAPCKEVNEAYNGLRQELDVLQKEYEESQEEAERAILEAFISKFDNGKYKELVEEPKKEDS
jgi:hypothetical protein